MDQSLVRQRSRCVLGATKGTKRLVRTTSRRSSVSAASVLTSCSHCGMVNIVRQAQAVSGIEKVHAVLGGFHLTPYKEDYVREVVASLKELNPDYIVPMHCTGEPFYEMVKAEMAEKLLRSFAGTRFVFDTEGHT